MAGYTGVGTLYSNNKVSVVLDWSQLDADVYQWQVGDDCGFASSALVVNENLGNTQWLQSPTSYTTGG